MKSLIFIKLPNLKKEMINNNKKKINSNQQINKAREKRKHVRLNISRKIKNG